MSPSLRRDQGERDPPPGRSRNRSTVNDKVIVEQKRWEPEIRLAASEVEVESWIQSQPAAQCWPLSDCGRENRQSAEWRSLKAFLDGDTYKQNPSVWSVRLRLLAPLVESMLTEKVSDVWSD